MKLRDLTKPQWDAALFAARELASGNPNVADDRARFRAAKERLAELLPDGANANDLISQAAHWNALNFVAGALAGIPGATIEQHREAGSPNKQPASNS
jgi:hypothetical protein